MQNVAALKQNKQLEQSEKRANAQRNNANKHTQKKHQHANMINKFACKLTTGMQCERRLMRAWTHQPFSQMYCFCQILLHFFQISKDHVKAPEDPTDNKATMIPIAHDGKAARAIFGCLLFFGLELRTVFDALTEIGVCGGGVLGLTGRMFNIFVSPFGPIFFTFQGL